MMIYEKYEKAISESRKQQREIEKLIVQNRNETRPVVVEENKRTIERLVQEHLEYDEMTRHDYEYDIERLNQEINRLFLESQRTGLSSMRQAKLEIQLLQRGKLLELAKYNPDIMYLVNDTKEKNSTSRKK